MSTKTSTELSLDQIIDNERSRYKRKGYGLIFSFLITITWFFLIPKLGPALWPYKIQNEGVFFFILTYICHEIVFLSNNFIMWIIYRLELPFFEKYKVYPTPWPWKEDPEKWYKLLKETILILFVNHVLVLPWLTVRFYFENESPFRMDYETLPGSFEIIWQTFFFMLCDDFTFYWSHRFLHWDKIYPYFHKLHHKYVHAISVASEFAHPVEFLIGNVLTANIGPYLLGKSVHHFTLIMWIIMRVSETTEGHTGYEFSWSPYRLLPMSGSSEYHNHHHLNFKGNYSSFFTYWDTICGTLNVKYLEYLQKKKEITAKDQKNN